MRFSKYYKGKKAQEILELQKGDIVEILQDFLAQAGAGLVTPMKKGFRGIVTIFDPDADMCGVFISDLNVEEFLPKEYLKKLKIVEE